MQDVEKLALIFMKALHLYIKNRTGIDFYPIMLQYLLCQPLLIFILDAHELLKSFPVISPFLKAIHK